jgi:hypothetical protein
MNPETNIASLSPNLADFAEVAGHVAGVRQRFYGMHLEDAILAPLVRELRWTHTDRSFAPALIAECQTILLDKKLLQARAHEFYFQSGPEGENS